MDMCELYESPLHSYSGMCETLTSLTNGTLSVQTDGVVTRVIYQCDVGFSMVGSQSGECQSDGSWNFGTPVCGK